MRPFIDYSGRVINKIKVIKTVGSNEHGHKLWLCLCLNCNNKLTITSTNLKHQNSKSCKSCALTTHDKSYHNLYSRWSALKRRDWLCDEWLDINLFVRDINLLLEKELIGRDSKYQLRRINVDKKLSKSNLKIFNQQ